MTSKLPFRHNGSPVLDGGLMFFKSTAAIAAGNFQTIIDLAVGMDLPLHSNTLVTKREAFAALRNSNSNPNLCIALELGQWTGATAATALPIFSMTSETPPNQLLTSNPRIDVQSTLDFMSAGSVVKLPLSFTTHPDNWTKFAFNLVIPAGVSLSSLTIYFSET